MRNEGRATEIVNNWVDVTVYFSLRKFFKVCLMLKAKCMPLSGDL